MKNHEIEINGEVYVKKVEAIEGVYCIVRTRSAGVFAGILTERNGMEGTILNARRLWYWSGAASLSQLAIDGVANPNKCHFPQEVPVITVTEIIEIIPCTTEARESIARVPVWKI